MKYLLVLYTSTFIYLCPSAVKQTFYLSQARPADAVVLSVPCELFQNETSNDNVYQHHLRSSRSLFLEVDLITNWS